jgi:predicted metal-dependent phosphoesterase TrpH
MLKADLHVHTNCSADCLMSVDRIIAACLTKGVNCIAVTDHNTVEGAFLLQKKAPFRVIVGEEIKTSEGEIIGYFLQDEIRAGMTPEETVAEIKKQGGLVCVPHPFDRLRRSKLSTDALHRIIDRVDLLEVFNSRNVFAADNAMALRLATERGIPMTAGSDAHWPGEIGSSFVEMDEFDGAADFCRVMAGARRITGKSGFLVHMGTKLVKWKLIR